MKKLLQPARLGVLMLLVFAAVAAAPGAASAQTIEGTATGKTIAQGNGTFRIVGTYTDASTGEVGTYVGTYVEYTTGYTSCPFPTFAGEMACFEDPGLARCNLIRGEVTVRSQGEMLTLSIASQLFPVITSAVCLKGTDDPQSYDVFLELMGSRDGFIYAEGSMRGTSAPLGGGVYEDTFVISIVAYPSD
jgi:hypothetical protein